MVALNLKTGMSKSPIKDYVGRQHAGPTHINISVDVSAWPESISNSGDGQAGKSSGMIYNLKHQE